MKINSGIINVFLLNVVTAGLFEVFLLLDLKMRNIFMFDAKQKITNKTNMIMYAYCVGPTSYYNNGEYYDEE